jgi:hypothetical protein
VTTDALPDRANPNAADDTEAVHAELNVIRGNIGAGADGAVDLTLAAEAVRPSPANEPAPEASEAGAAAGPEHSVERQVVSDAERGLESIDIPSEQSLAFFEARADRLVANYRPSWEPPEPVAAPATQLTSSAAQRSTPSGPAAAPTAIAPDSDLDSISVPGIRPRRQGMLMAMAAVICFGVLTALAVRSGGIGSRAKPVEKQRIAATSIPEPQTQQPAPPTPNAPADIRSAPAARANPPSAPAPPEAEAPSPAPTVPSAVLPVASAALPAPPTLVPDPPAAVIIPPAAAPPPIVAVKMARVRISTSPKNAELLVDGTKTQNPFDMRLPAGSVHQVHAQAPGHLDQDITLSLDRDRTLALRLNKSPAPASTPIAQKPRPRTAAAAARRRTPRPVATPTPSTQRRTTGAGFVSDSPY